MNWIDLCILLILFYFAYRGYVVGLAGSVFHLASTAVSLLVSIRLYGPVGSFFEQIGANKTIAPVLGFFALFILFELFLSFLFSLLHKIVFNIFAFLKPLLWLDKIAGVFAQLTLAIVLIAISLTVSLRVPMSVSFKSAVLSSFWGREVLPQTVLFEPQIRAFLGTIPQETLLYLIPKAPSSEENIKMNFPSADEMDLQVDESAEQEMLELVNQERQSRGLKIVVQDPTIIAVTRLHGFDMFRRSFFSHLNPDGKTPFERMRHGGVEYLLAGENLAYAPTVEIAHKGLMNSPGHRENILRAEFGRIGIGVVDGGIYGKMFTQNFAD
jgi:uncharacterized protein YkwD